MASRRTPHGVIYKWNCSEHIGTVKEYCRAVAGKLLEGEPQKRPPRPALPSVVKAVANLGVDFAGIEEVGSAEGETVVEEDAAVGDVDGVDVDGEAFAKTFAEGQVEGGVTGQSALGSPGAALPLVKPEA